MAKIVSGGQTGVDRAALDLALSLNHPCGGWCPRGRKAEDGPLDPVYPLQETPSDQYEQRTEWNVRDSDGTLVLTHGEVTGGTALTIELARAMAKPCLVLDLAAPADPHIAWSWIKTEKVRVLNVAGSRESLKPGVYHAALQFLRTVLELRDKES